MEPVGPRLVDDAVRVVKELGFPIAMVLYLLFRFDRLLGEVRDVVRELAIQLRTQRPSP